VKLRGSCQGERTGKKALEYEKQFFQRNSGMKTDYGKKKKDF